MAAAGYQYRQRHGRCWRVGRCRRRRKHGALPMRCWCSDARPFACQAAAWKGCGHRKCGGSHFRCARPCKRSREANSSGWSGIGMRTTMLGGMITDPRLLTRIAGTCWNF
jgi:hypothetical protein